ncbi:histidine phosphatase family protein [Vagococcus humatus]|uniref:Histidine phosphatase family protein n=1 Tax=Vagococcus humatus TaxID=1889241 RepID=A0A429Z9B2_9ENTE|nr:histidine phosphatase family protein [Vagococcus humatus]RST90299.1 histidine phosphatase family protein [Vagococcus humatus]
MKIILIRHGETDYNAKKCFYGRLDVSINQTGQDQARQLATKLASCHPDRLITSQLVRTKETASLIFPTYTQEANSSLNEKGFGNWEGKTANQIEACYKDDWQAWLEDPLGYTPATVEPFSSFKQRVLTGIASYLVEPTEPEAVYVFVLHLGVIRLLLSEWFPNYSFWDIQLDQGNYTLLDYQPDKWRVLNWNI